MKLTPKAPVKENETITKLFRATAITALSIFPATAFMIDLKVQSKNFINIIVFVLSLALVNKFMSIRDKRCKIISFILGVVFASFMTFGNYKTNCKSFFTFFLCFTGFSIFFSGAASFILVSVQHISLLKDGKRNNSKKVFWLSILVVLIAWLPHFLAYFPAFTTQDSIAQLEQVVGVRQWCNWHPVVHTLIIKATYSLGLAISGGNQATGVAVYTIVQIAFMALVFAYFLVTLYKLNIHKYAIIASLGFFAFFPVIPLYNMVMWKDIWFAGIVLAFLTTLWRLLKYQKEDQTAKLPLFETIMFFVLAVCVCLFRSNGYYAFILTIPFLFIVFRKKMVKVALIAVVAFACAFIIKGPVYNACNVQKADILETIGVPMQHICGTITDGAELTDDEEEFVSNILEIDKIKESYKLTVVDTIKKAVREEGNLEYLETHKKDFVSLWFHLGMRHPLSYLKAQIFETYGFWYPDIEYWQSPWFLNDGFNYEQTPLMPETLCNIVTLFDTIYLAVPVISVFWSLGLYTWLLLLTFCFSIFRKQKSTWALYILPLAIILSLMLATPAYAESRYAYSIVISSPLFIIAPLAEKEVKNNG